MNKSNLKEDEQRTIPNTNLSHYRIVSKIGAGGMGESEPRFKAMLKRLNLPE